MYLQTSDTLTAQYTDLTTRNRRHSDTGSCSFIVGKDAISIRLSSAFLVLIGQGILLLQCSYYFARTIVLNLYRDRGGHKIELKHLERFWAHFSRHFYRR